MSEGVRGRSRTGDAEDEEEELAGEGDSSAHGEVRLCNGCKGVSLTSRTQWRAAREALDRLTMTEMTANWADSSQESAFVLLNSRTRVRSHIEREHGRTIVKMMAPLQYFSYHK